MIKFRKGGILEKATQALNETTLAPAAAAAPAANSTGKWQPEQVVNLEWWQTPVKYKRRDVDDLEIDLINVGYNFIRIIVTLHFSFFAIYRVVELTKSIIRSFV